MERRPELISHMQEWTLDSSLKYLDAKYPSLTPAEDKAKRVDNEFAVSCRQDALVLSAECPDCGSEAGCQHAKDCTYERRVRTHGVGESLLVSPDRTTEDKVPSLTPAEQHTHDEVKAAIAGMTALWDTATPEQNSRMFRLPIQYGLFPLVVMERNGCDLDQALTTIEAMVAEAPDDLALDLRCLDCGHPLTEGTHFTCGASKV